MSFSLSDPDQPNPAAGYAQIALGNFQGIFGALANSGVGTALLSTVAQGTIAQAQQAVAAALRNPTITNVFHAQNLIIRAYTVINQEFVVPVLLEMPRTYSVTLPDDDDEIDVPATSAEPVATPTFLGVPLGIVYGVNVQGLATVVGLQTEIGFAPANPAFGWIDTFTLTQNDPNSAPTCVGAVPGAPGQGGTSATSDPTDSSPPGPGSPGSADGTAW